MLNKSVMQSGQFWTNAQEHRSAQVMQLFLKNIYGLRPVSYSDLKVEYGQTFQLVTSKGLNNVLCLTLTIMPSETFMGLGPVVLHT